MLQAGLRPDDSDHQAYAVDAAKLHALFGGVYGFNEAQDDMMNSLPKLTPRKGMKLAFERYAAAGVQAWGATNGSLKLAQTIFANALGKEAAEKVHLFSCDEVKIAKPDPRVYAAIKERIAKADSTAAGGEDVELWFVATHSWDTFAAKRAG